MNERIDELFGKALDGAVPETWTVLNPEQLSRLKTKFAELIVRECARVAKQTDSYDDDVYKSGRTWAGIDILKHFGVEE